MADYTIRVNLWEIENAIFDGLNKNREIRRAISDFVDDVHDTWVRFAPKSATPRTKDRTVAERWATYLEVRGQPGHPYATNTYVRHIKKKKLTLLQRLFTKRTIGKGIPIGTVYNDAENAHWVEYGTAADGPGSRSRWGPATPTPEYAPMRKTVARYMNDVRIT